MLGTFEDAISIRVPPVGDPRERNGSFDTRPELLEERLITRQAPIQIDLDDLAHLAVGRGRREAVGAIRQCLPEAHTAVVVHRVPEGGTAQRLREARKEVRRRRLVVPDVRAVAVTAAAGFAAAFEAVELAVRSAEARLRDERGQVGGGTVLRGRRKRALTDRISEAAGAALEIVEMFGEVARGVPGIWEACAVVVANQGAALSRCRVPPAAIRRAIRKAPADGKGEICGRARCDRALQTDGSHRSRLRGLRPERAIVREVVPEMERARPPARSRPSPQHRHASIAGSDHPEAHCAGQRVVIGDRGIAEQQAFNARSRARLVDAGILLVRRDAKRQQWIFE